MAYIVGRPKDRWEIRESVTTPNGPRARSLASFRTLDDGVLDRAERAAVTPFSRADVVAAARRVGAPVGEPTADRLTRALLAELRAGRAPKPGLRGALADALSRIEPPVVLEELQAVVNWAGVSNEERGRALRDLLELGDRLPVRAGRALQFPLLRQGNV